MVRKVNGKWQMANGIKKLYAIRYTLYAKKGFTLVELLIVVGVIGLLASMFLGVYSQSQKRARDGQRKFDLNSVKSALEQYHSDNQAYPMAGNYAALTATSGTYSLVVSKDLKIAPHDPATTPDYYFRPLNIDGSTTCSVAAQCQDYLLCAKLENVNDADITGATPRHPCRLQSGAAPTGISGHNFGLRSP